MSKDPILACLLNLVLVGTGHMYLGRIVKGLVILTIAIALGVPTHGIGTIPVIVWAMHDAYKTAKNMNRSARKPLASPME